MKIWEVFCYDIYSNDTPMSDGIFISKQLAEDYIKYVTTENRSSMWMGYYVKEREVLEDF